MTPDVEFTRGVIPAGADRETSSRSIMAESKILPELEVMPGMVYEVPEASSTMLPATSMLSVEVAR